MTRYYALLTNLGAAKLANAAALGTKLQITHMSVGDGGGTLPTPNASQTALVAEKRRAALNALSVDAANSSQIIAEQIIPETDGGFWIREIGLFDADGVMIAVANCPETYKPQLQEGSGRTQTVRMILIVNSTDAVTLKIDPSVVLATRKYVDEGVIVVKAYADSLMAQHLAAADPHPQYAPKASPALTGKPTGPTAAKTDNSTQLATTAHVKSVVGDYAPLASPAFSGTPTAPTAAAGNSSQQMANTAFVQAAIAALVSGSPAALDTLKELADALGGDPNFATTVLNKLAEKLAKNQNGADIPDKAEFLANLGLGEAAKCNVGTTPGTVAAGDDPRLVGAIQKKSPTLVTAWVNFSVAGGVITINDSYNVSSVVRTATGRFNVIFTNAMKNAFYCPSVISRRPTAGTSEDGICYGLGSLNRVMSVNQFPISINNAASTAEDPPFCCVSVSGGL
ncbi:phage tail protein [Erwinia sp. MYb416]|uniref:phage tail protein n=1 Tax=Erwinia sp. MYb416 TaxID=3108532 RepID=UPI0030A8A25C